MKSSRPVSILPLLLVAATLPSCSVKGMAVNALGNALAEGGSVYASDDDPELVREAIPFGLKTIESLLEEAPRHEGLLFAATSNFTQYAYAFLEQDADFVEDEDYQRAAELRARCLKLYQRALRYGLRGLEVERPGFEAQFRADPEGTLAHFDKKEQAAILYWTAASWGAAISLAKDNSELSADQHLAEALARRALELDEAYDQGAIHDFFIAYEGGRLSIGGSLEKAQRHFDRAITLSQGHRASPFVSWAETVSVGNQDREEFERLLEQALAVDVDAAPRQRLANLVAQKRARWLLARAEDLFI
jgi:predicted anti-sigma-YlaC factor YlaD